MTNRKSIDITTLSGWSSLSDGSHNITVVAKADGYADSEPSAAVSVEKAPAIKTLAAGTYKWKNALSGTWLGRVSNYKALAEFSFSSNGKSFQKIMQVRNSFNDNQQMQYWSPAFLAYDFTTNVWDNTAYQTISLATDQQVSADFYDWAITGGNLVKQS